MHITLETDYAFRIVDYLARSKTRASAKSIAEETGVTLRFALKILRKLVSNGIVQSYKGTQGGYEIARPLAAISMYDVLQTIEGPYVLSRCLRDGLCIRAEKGRCSYYKIFGEISFQVQAKLKSISMAEIASQRRK